MTTLQCAVKIKYLSLKTPTLLAGSSNRMKPIPVPNYGVLKEYSFQHPKVTWQHHSKGPKMIKLFHLQYCKQFSTSCLSNHCFLKPCYWQFPHPFSYLDCPSFPGHLRVHAIGCAMNLQGYTLHLQGVLQS